MTYQVMLVEDEARTRSGVKTLLEEVIGGFRVTAEASNGKEALKLLWNEKPDLLITDVRMPVMDGIELCEQLYEQQIDFPILIMSGHGDFDYVRRALRTGVSDYLLKPVDRIEFKQTLEKLFPPTAAAPKPTRAAGSEHKIIAEAKQIMAKRFHQAVSLQTVAEEVGLSFQYLSQLFKKECGIHFSDYLTELRIGKAKQLLSETHMKIYEISELCGYANPKYFMNAFKKATGLTPKEFRKQS